MSRRRSLQARIDDYLAERRRQGFRLRSGDAFLSRFARFELCASSCAKGLIRYSVDSGLPWSARRA